MCCACFFASVNVGVWPQRRGPVSNKDKEEEKKARAAAHAKRSSVGAIKNDGNADASVDASGLDRLADLIDESGLADALRVQIDDPLAMA